MAAPNTLPLPRWERACEEQAGSERTERLPVPGGWLYRTEVWNPDTGHEAVAMVFVPLASAPR